MDLVQFIDKLDLNCYEKEIILFLASIDNAEAKTIYKNTKVPQGRIYSVLNNLVQKNLIKIIPTSPKKYKIENVKDSLKMYLEMKESSLKKRIEEINSLSINPKRFTLDKNTPSVYSFTGRDEHLNALISVRNQAKAELLQIAPLFDGTFASNVSIYKALQRGVKLKVITRKITPGNKKNIRECLSLGAEVRYVDSPDLIYFLIKDSEEFILGLEDHKNQEERLSLYSRNKGLLQVLRRYFEELWKDAKVIEKSELNQFF